MYIRIDRLFDCCSVNFDFNAQQATNMIVSLKASFAILKNNLYNAKMVDCNVMYFVYFASVDLARILLCFSNWLIVVD